jgi:hypothetical protein
MDATQRAREEKKAQLFQQLSELLVEEQRQRGVFDETPHYSQLERAARDWALQFSRLAQGRAAAEVATLGTALALCPECGRQESVATQQRTVMSLDGPVELLEQVAHCVACRRDFFPSA